MLTPMLEPKVYRKRPVPVRAIQWTGNNAGAVSDFVGIMANMDGDVSTCRFLLPEAIDSEGEALYHDGLARLWVEANSSWLPIEVGEWILRDRIGFYPCKDRQFVETYDEVTE